MQKNEPLKRPSSEIVMAAPCTVATSGLPRAAPLRRKWQKWNGTAVHRTQASRMHRLRVSFAAALAVTMSGCSNGTPPAAALPQTVSMSVPHSAFGDPNLKRRPLAQNGLRKGAYVAEYYTNSVLGYAWSTLPQDRPPVCALSGTYVVNVATDTGGNVVVPDGGSRTVSVYRGPKLCGPLLGRFADNDGQPSDAATTDAAHARIYVANIQAKNQPYGDVSVCTLAAGCNAVLQNSAIGGQLFAVAEDTAGNVYASGYTQASGSGASLVLWKGAAGSGNRLRAYRNGSPGGLTFDTHGRLLALDTFAAGSGALWVYSGCPSHCKAHGPFSLHGESVFGKLDASETYFAAADFEYGQVDVYRYRGTNGIAYLYSFADGLVPSADVEGIALNPANS